MAKLADRFGNFVQWFKRGRKSGPIAGDTPTDGGVMVAEMEQDDALPIKRIARESPMDKLQRGYEEMVSLMSSVRNHLETQAQRSERLLRVLDGLPEALKSLPEATRNQTRTLEAIQTNLNQQVQHNTKLAEALNGLSQSTKHHEHAMSAIGQQLDAGHQRSEQILGSFNSLTGTLDRMADANEAGTILLRRMAEQESQAAEQVRQLFIRNQKQMTTMSIVSWSLALVALTVASFVAVSVSKIGGQAPITNASQPAAPAPAQPSAPAIVPTNDTPAVEEETTKINLLDDSTATTKGEAPGEAPGESPIASQAAATTAAD